MKQEAATQIKSKANRNKTIRILMTDKSQRILAYYVPFGIMLPYYFGYFSQWELFQSLLPNLNICISNIVTNFLFSDWEEHAIETRGTLSTFFFFFIMTYTDHCLHFCLTANFWYYGYILHICISILLIFVDDTISLNKW